MKVIYLAFKMIWKQKFLNLFLIITVVCSIYYLAPVLERVINYRDSAQALSQVDMEDAYYLYCNPLYSRRDEKVNDSINEKVSRMENLTGRAEIFNLIDEEGRYYIVAYNDLLIDKFRPKLSEGVWLNEAEEYDHIPVVVASDTNLKRGESFPLSLSIENKSLELTCKVVGVLEDSARILSFSGAADEKYFTTDALLSSGDLTLLLPLTEEIGEFIDGKEYLLNSGGSLLYTLPKTTYEEIWEAFGYAGIVTDLQRGNKRFYEQTKYTAAAMSAYFAVYFLITIICLLCNSFILSVSTRKTYAIYFLYGMSRSKQMEIEAVRIFFSVFTCTVVSLLFLGKRGVLANCFEGVPLPLMILGVVCYICIIYLPISVGFVIKDRRIDMLNTICSLSTKL